MSVKKLVTDNLSNLDKAKLGVTAIVKGKEEAKAQAIQKALPKIASSALPLARVALVGGLVYWMVKSGIESRRRKRIEPPGEYLKVKQSKSDRIIKSVR